MTAVISKAITANKANRLYWLGRYAERVYLSLHLLRKFYDQMIDGPENAYLEYHKKLDASSEYTDEISFMKGYMYDEKNPNSLMAGLIAANDNAIVLREEIKSETLSYIQLSMVKLQEAADAGETNITELQSITDYLLAFWGSAGERIYNDDIRLLMRLGRLVEFLDILIRFDYPFYRVNDCYEGMKSTAEHFDGILDTMILRQLDKLVDEDLFDLSDPEYKFKLLKYINHLVLI